MLNERIDSIIDFILGIGRKYKFVKPKMASLLEEIMNKWKPNVADESFYDFLRILLQDVILIPAGAGIKDLSGIQVKYKYCPNGSPIRQDDLEPKIRWELDNYDGRWFTKDYLPNTIKCAEQTSKMK